MTPLAYALDLAWNDVPVLPCNVEDGRPLTELTAASKNRETISGWWQRWPNAVPAVPTGRVSGLGVIHVDDLAHLTEVSRTWYDQHADLLRTTRTHHTPAAGRDFWFRLPDGVTTVSAAPAVWNGVPLDWRDRLHRWGFHSLLASARPAARGECAALARGVSRLVRSTRRGQCRRADGSR
jgi:hypothetical protein